MVAIGHTMFELSGFADVVAVFWEPDVRHIQIYSSAFLVRCAIFCVHDKANSRWIGHLVCFVWLTG